MMQGGIDVTLITDSMVPPIR
nr:hypothetical protein P5621_07695 [Bacillus subtilis]